MSFRQIQLMIYALILVLPASVLGASSNEDSKDSKDSKEGQEEIVVLGTRSAKMRSAVDSPVPIDIIDSEDFSMVGGTADITDNFNTLVPSYIATPATGDGSAFVRPTSLRGMAGDQTLVLLNGKRRHRSALVQLFAPAANNGSHGPDMAMIPAIALKNVEIMRDGASAQYGSDAIAGVINFALKDSAEGGSVETTFGKHFEGENSWRVAANSGFSLGEGSFINLSVDSNEAKALSRGRQRPNAQALIDSGVSGVGIDSPFGDAPLVQTWGRPETSGTRFFFNAGYELPGNKDLYLFGNYAKTKGRFRFFYRAPGHKSLTQNSASAGNLEREKMAGFTPYLDGEQDDFSTVLGLRGQLGFIENTTYDISLGTGMNKLDYTLYNSLNERAPLLQGTSSGGNDAQRDFNTGDYKQKELNFNVDFSTELSAMLNLAYGLEYRQETFEQLVAEYNAYVGEGVSGMSGTKPQDAGQYERSNISLYADLEHDMSEELLLQYALRLENFSDFGTTINGKLAGRYSVTPTLSLRGAVSTGFHAPTPGQANLQATTTTFDNSGDQIDKILVPADSAEAKAVGGTELTEEKSFNLSMGLASELGRHSTVTFDVYHIGVSDRIYRTSVGKTSFYTNALDVNHKGFDLVWTSDVRLWPKVADTSLSFAYNYNSVEVAKNKTINGKQVVSDDLVEDIENNYPKHNFTLTTNTRFARQWNLMVRVRYIGSHYDERGNIEGTSSNGKSQEIDGLAYIDAELGYRPLTNLSLAIGGANILDKYPKTLEDVDGMANRMSVGLPYPRRSAANYEGGSWYLKAVYHF